MLLVLADDAGAAAALPALPGPLVCDVVCVELLLGAKLAVIALEEALSRRSSLREALSVVSMPFSL